jgi:hypothetical protein
LMSKEVGIVKVLSLLWLAKVGEVVLFLVVHCCFLDWSVGRLPSPLVFRWLLYSQRESIGLAILGRMTSSLR